MKNVKDLQAKTNETAPPTASQIQELAAEELKAVSGGPEVENKPEV
jgi:hypothetical protein